MRHWLALLAGPREGIPNAIKNDEHHLNSVLVSARQELVQAFEKTVPILVPEQVVQKNPDAGETQVLRPAEFPVDGRRVPSVGLPHLQLVNSAARREVAAGQPALLCLPVVSLLVGPLPARINGFPRRGAAAGQQEQHGNDR
jgi:hypothetical protein